MKTLRDATSVDSKLCKGKSAQTEETQNGRLVKGQTNQELNITKHLCEVPRTSCKSSLTI